MPAAFNSTTYGNSIISCNAAIYSLQSHLEGAQRLNYILGGLLGLVSLLFLCGPLIFSRSSAQVVKEDDVEGMPHPDRFALADEIENGDAASTSPLSENTKGSVDVMIGGKMYLTNNKSETSLLVATGIFHGLPNERELAAQCVRDGNVSPHSIYSVGEHQVRKASPSVRSSTPDSVSFVSVIPANNIDISETKPSSNSQGQQSSERKLC